WRIVYIVKFGPKLITSTQHCKSTFQIEAQNHSLQKKEEKEEDAEMRYKMRLH
ncbi:hypothetical protein COCVIDRAFT_87779, partial [Bipolaris victoriae FI3]